MIYVFDLDNTLILHQNEVNYDWIYEDIELSYHLDQCQGKKYIFTNGTKSHADIILKKMNIKDKFERVFARDDFGFKPNMEVFQKVDDVIRAGDKEIDVVFFDDMYVNLVSAKKIGWSPCWIHRYYESGVFNENIDDGYVDIKAALKFINHSFKYK